MLKLGIIGTELDFTRIYYSCSSDGPLSLAGCVFEKDEDSSRVL